MVLQNKIATLIVGFLVGSVTFFFDNFMENFLGLSVYLLLLIAAFISSLALNFFQKNKVLPQTLFLWAGAEAAVIVRAIFDIVFIDPESHNLLGLEIILTSIYIFPAALAGAFVSWLVFRQKRS